MPLLLALVNWDKDCDKLTDEELVAMIHAGEPARSKALKCFIKSFKRFFNTMKSKHSLLSAEDIEDAFSHAINQLYTYIAAGRYEGQAKLTTLFYTIFHRRCIDLGRLGANKGQNRGEFPPNISDPNPDPSDTLEENDQKETLRKAMERLSEKCRNVLIDWNEGYSMEEIAERNGLANANTAKSTKNNCLNKLRGFLSGGNK